MCFAKIQKRLYSVVLFQDFDKVNNSIYHSCTCTDASNVERFSTDKVAFIQLCLKQRSVFLGRYKFEEIATELTMGICSSSEILIFLAQKGLTDLHLHEESQDCLAAMMGTLNEIFPGVGMSIDDVTPVLIRMRKH